MPQEADQTQKQAQNQALWTAVDHYLAQTLIPADPILDATLAANAAAELPAIDVAPNQGKLLHILARLANAQRILEIGTLGGYSTIWLARALPPNGHLITCEFEPRHATVARANLTRAGLAHLVDIRIGRAEDSLIRLYAEDPTPFDLIFIDADKPSNPIYLAWALKFSRPGTIILCDNVIREGAILDANSKDERVQGVRQFFADAAANPRLTMTALQTVGSKGYDGLALAIVNGD
jgi:predicted O-methyltransferase YrrM